MADMVNNMSHIDLFEKTSALLPKARDQLVGTAPVDVALATLKGTLVHTHRMRSHGRVSEREDETVHDKAESQKLCRTLV